jgi:hypothetical protein
MTLFPVIFFPPTKSRIVQKITRNNQTLDRGIKDPFLGWDVHRIYAYTSGNPVDAQNSDNAQIMADRHRIPSLEKNLQYLCAMNTSIRIVSSSSKSAVPHTSPLRLRETSRAYGTAALARIVYLAARVRVVPCPSAYKRRRALRLRCHFRFPHKIRFL